MKKIFLSLVAVLSAVTLMAQQPTACDAQLQFKFCFNSSANLDSAIYASALPFTWNGQIFPADGTYPMQKETTIQNYRGCDSTVTMTVSVQFPPKGSAGGNNAKPFSVSATKQVVFSQGNLQYRATADGTGTDLINTTVDGSQYGEFRFAENQWDWIRPVDNTALNSTVYYFNGNTNVRCDNYVNLRGSDYRSWLDLLTYGASGYNAGTKVGQITPWKNYLDIWSTNSSSTWEKVPKDIAGTKFDWGVFNNIKIDANNVATYGTWRTLTKDEWIYVLSKRTDATSKLMHATITDNNGNTIAKGLILLPDNWTMPAGITLNSGISGTPVWDEQHGTMVMSFTSKQGNWEYNKFTYSQWSTLEAAGAVFLPANNYANTTNVSFSGMLGHYWSSTGDTNNSYITPYTVVIGSTELKVSYMMNNYYYNYGYEGRCVRLVTDK